MDDEKRTQLQRDVPAHEHGVQHDPEAPHVRSSARVLGVRPEERTKNSLRFEGTVTRKQPDPSIILYENTTFKTSKTNNERFLFNLNPDVNQPPCPYNC